MEKTTEFCGHCGQNSRDFSQPFWHIIRDAISELFEIDGRVVRSLKTILIKPGQLSIEFEANRRATFISPIRALLFTSFIWFIMFSVALEQSQPLDIDDRPFAEEARAEMQEIRVEFAEKDLDVGIRLLRQQFWGNKLAQIDLTLEQDDAARKRWLLLAAQIMQSEPNLPFWLRGVIAKVAEDLTYSPKSLRDSVIDNFPIMMFVLLPWFTTLLTVFFGRRGKKLIHHLVFAFHVHIFAFMISTLILITPEPAAAVSQENWSWVEYSFETLDSILIAIFYVHTYLAFKRYYGDSYLKTVVKYLSLGIMYLIGLVPAFVLVLAVTLLGYL